MESKWIRAGATNTNKLKKISKTKLQSKWKIIEIKTSNRKNLLIQNYSIATYKFKISVSMKKLCQV